MIRTNKILVLLLVIAAVALPRLPGAAAQPTNAPAPGRPSTTPADLFPDSVVAKGRGLEIKRSALDAEVIRQKANAAAQQMQLPPDLEARLLNKMIQLQLLLTKATPEDKAKGQADVDAYVKRIKTSAKLSDEEFNQRLDQQLRATGQTREQWEKQNIEQATIPAILEHELKVTISEDDARKFYDAHPANFEEPEKVHVSHILFSTRESDGRMELSAEKQAAKRKLAEDVLKRARDGADFAKLVKEFSEDPGSKDTGGEYTFPRNQMVPEFELAAFSLKTNQISDLVTTKYGYHIIKLLERSPARKEPYAGLDTKTILTKGDGQKALVREVLADEARQKLLPGYLAKLRTDADVQVLDDSLKFKEPAETPALPAGHPPLKSSEPPAKKADKQ